MIKRTFDHVMVPGTQVLDPEGRERQLWVGDKHEEGARRQAAALNKLVCEGHKAVPVWVERPERKRNGSQ